MLENDNLDIRWSMTFDGLQVSQKQSVAISKDGSLVAVMTFSPQSIILMNAMTGEVRASISSTLTISNTNSLPNLILTGNASTLAEIYV